MRATTARQFQTQTAIMSPSRSSEQNEGTMYYRESVGLGKEFAATTGAGLPLPRARSALHEVGVDFVLPSSPSHSHTPFSPSSSSSSSGVASPTASGGGGSGSYRWADSPTGHESGRQSAFPNWQQQSSPSSASSSRRRANTANSVIGRAREARRDEARGTDPFTQTVASPPGSNIDPGSYGTLRKVMPGGADQNTASWGSQREEMGGGGEHTTGKGRQQSRAQSRGAAQSRGRGGGTVDYSGDDGFAASSRQQQMPGSSRMTTPALSSYIGAI
jgi:hypothetical protein